MARQFLLTMFCTPLGLCKQARRACQVPQVLPGLPAEGHQLAQAAVQPARHCRHRQPHGVGLPLCGLADPFGRRSRNGYGQMPPMQ